MGGTMQGVQIEVVRGSLRFNVSGEPLAGVQLSQWSLSCHVCGCDFRDGLRFPGQCLLICSPCLDKLNGVCREQISDPAPGQAERPGVRGCIRHQRGSQRSDPRI